MRPIMRPIPRSNLHSKMHPTFYSRFSLFLIFSLLVFGAASIVRAEESRSNTASFDSFNSFDSTESEPPFPFGETNVAEDVPIPPDTEVGLVAARKAEGYVPQIYSRSAPKPEPLLRPRYQGRTDVADLASADRVSERKKDGTVPRLPTQQNGRKAALKDRASRQNEASTLSSTLSSAEKMSSVSIPSPTAQPLTKAELTVFEPIREEAANWSRGEGGTSFGDALSASDDDRGNYFATPVSAMSVIDDHSCDEIGCTDGCGGCGMGSGVGCGSASWQFRHLGLEEPKRGLCDACGLLGCSRKYRFPWFFDGWASVGSFMNTSWPEGKVNQPLYYNDRNGDVVLNQLYLTFGRKVNSRLNRWDIGGRVDLLYGTDYFYTGSLGLETRRTQYITGQQTMDPLEASLHWNSNSGNRRNDSASRYGFSMPQAYAEVFAPIGNGLTIKAGHFYADMGLESAMSPNNFFYSHSYGFMYGAPVTLTGATATTRIGRRLTATAGFSQGWDVWDSPTGKINGLFGLRWDGLDRRSSLSLMLHTGANSTRGNDNRTNYVLTYQRQLGERWYYALEHTYGEEKNGALLYSGLFDEQRGQARWVSLAQYLQWRWSERFALGFRAEWFRDQGHSRIQKGAVEELFFKINGRNYYQLTLGANWKPTRFVTIRPEVRYDWSDVQYNRQGGVYSRGEKKEMVSFAIDAVFRF